MKVYVRASYDSSMPSWLKTPAGKYALESLTYKYAVSQAKFYPDPQPDSIPIYLLDDTYEEKKSFGEVFKTPAGQFVYIPSLKYGADTRFLSTGVNFRNLTKASSDRIKEHIIDTVYMVAPLRNDIRKDRDYQDPRTSHRGDYAGQVPNYDSHYNEETKMWEKDESPSSYYTPSGRDKSGYEIPKPEDLYAKLYERFPERLKSRVNEAKSILDEYYNKIDAAKNAIFSKYDIRKGKGISMYSKNSWDNVFYKLNEAIQYYGWMYSDFDHCIREDGSVDPVKLATFLKSNNYDGLKHRTQSIDNYIEGIYKKLG